MRKRRIWFLLLFLLVSSALAAGLLAVRGLLTELAVSAAQDAVTDAAGRIVIELMREGMGDGLVTLERSANGSVTAVTTNVAAVNALASEALRRVVAATQERDLKLRAPVGTLFGLKTVTVPVTVRMLSSSRAGFRSELLDAGINQTRHRIVLTMRVDATLFMPWRRVEMAAETEILISETVIVGDVPQSYLNMERRS